MSRYRAVPSRHRPGTWDMIDTKRVIMIRNSLTEVAAANEAARLNAQEVGMYAGTGEASS